MTFIAANDPEESVRRLGQRGEPDGSLYRQPDIQASLLAAARENYRSGVTGAAYDSLLRLSPWGFDLAELAVPCLWWHGDADPVTPLSAVERAIEGLPQHSLHVVPGVGHGVSMTHTAPFLEALVGMRP